MTNDMTPTIVPKSDQINADDMIAGPITVEIVDVTIDLSQEQPVVIRLVGMDKVYRPCKTMRRVMVHAWGADTSLYAGRRLTLYCNPSVRFKGLEVGGIRISHVSHIDEPLTVVVTETNKRRAALSVGMLANTAPSAAKPVASAAPDPTSLQAAREAASRGRDAFGAWWKSASSDARAAATAIMDELKSNALAADSATAVPSPDDAPPM